MHNYSVCVVLICTINVFIGSLLYVCGNSEENPNSSVYNPDYGRLLKTIGIVMFSIGVIIGFCTVLFDRCIRKTDISTVTYIDNATETLPVYTEEPVYTVPLPLPMYTMYTMYTK